MITDATGVPLAVLVTGGHRHDVTQLVPLVKAVPPIRGRPGRPRRLLADRAYDHRKYRRQLAAQGITPSIARRGTPPGTGVGRQRWPVERTIGWLPPFRRVSGCLRGSGQPGRYRAARRRRLGSPFRWPFRGACWARRWVAGSALA